MNASLELLLLHYLFHLGCGRECSEKSWVANGAQKSVFGVHIGFVMVKASIIESFSMLILFNFFPTTEGLPFPIIIYFYYIDFYWTR